MKIGIAIALFLSLAVCSVSPVQAGPPPAGAGTKHTIKASVRPYKALGHEAKQAASATAGFSFTVFDAMVVDPFGVALQAFADGVDMAVAQPLEALPKPFNVVGKGVHLVYLGLDKVGQQLAK